MQGVTVTMLHQSLCPGVTLGLKDQSRVQGGLKSPNAQSPAAALGEVPGSLVQPCSPCSHPRASGANGRSSYRSSLSKESRVGPSLSSAPGTSPAPKQACAIFHKEAPWSLEYDSGVSSSPLLFSRLNFPSSFNLQAPQYPWA